MTRQRRISNGLWIVAVLCALIAPLVAVGLVDALHAWAQREIANG
jgi:hypothetical protein